jgi:hypothetical protein
MYGVSVRQSVYEGRVVGGGSISGLFNHETPTTDDPEIDIPVLFGLFTQVITVDGSVGVVYGGRIEKTNQVTYLIKLLDGSMKNYPKSELRLYDR